MKVLTFELEVYGLPLIPRYGYLEDCILQVDES